MQHEYGIREWNQLLINSGTSVREGVLTLEPRNQELNSELRLNNLQELSLSPPEPQLENSWNLRILRPHLETLPTSGVVLGPGAS